MVNLKGTGGRYSHSLIHDIILEFASIECTQPLKSSDSINDALF